jgi:hypothetical protein
MFQYALIVFLEVPAIVDLPRHDLLHDLGFSQQLVVRSQERQRT